MIIVGIIIAIILAAVTAPASKPKKDQITVSPEEAEPPAESVKAVTIGVFYWILLVVLIFIIAVGYYLASTNTKPITF